VLAAIALAAIAILVAGCRPAPSTTAAVELTIYGPASLQGALEDIGPAYALEASGVTLTMSTGASSALRTQIEQGAPADVFLSADTQHPAALVDGGLTAGGSRAFAGNELAIIKPVDALRVAEPVDLADPGVKIVATGEAVPIARYANQVVANLAALDGYPAGFPEAYAANIVSREDDVKAVVAKIELGEGDAAIVYRTDALAGDAIALIRIPDAANVRATYAGVIIKSSGHAVQAGAFLEWLVGPEGQAILASHGFTPPASAPSP
jgi:molybdate transport system substrate-binding protein